MARTREHGRAEQQELVVDHVAHRCRQMDGDGPGGPLADEPDTRTGGFTRQKVAERPERQTRGCLTPERRRVLQLGGFEPDGDDAD